MKARDGDNGFPAARFGRGIASLAHDATTIAELQAKLVALDLKASARFIRVGTILAVLGGLLLLACLPVGLIALAEMLIALAGWYTWVAYLVVAAAGIVGSGVLLWLAWSALQKSSGKLRRSREELLRNLEWFKQALKGEHADGRDPTATRR